MTALGLGLGRSGLTALHARINCYDPALELVAS